MRYLEYQPCERLRPFIRCFWTLSAGSPEPPAAQRVFPDGSIEIVFHFGDAFQRVHEDGSVERQGATLLAGQIWTPLTLRPGTRPDVLGIRFRPMGAAPFLRFPLDRIGGMVLPLEDVWGGRARSWRDMAVDSPNRVAAVERLLLECRPEPVEPMRALGIRQYRRRFEASVGIAPKMFERIRRFQKALASLGSLPLAELAANCGYYDQSHLIRDFRQFAGAPPSALLDGLANVPFFQDAARAEAIS